MVLLGENGTGKSSIVNSIEYLFSSYVSSLKGSGDINHDKSIRFFGKGGRDPKVKAIFDNGLTIERNEDGLKCPNEIKPLIKSLSNGGNILNRKKLLQFIDSQPKQRYDAIGNLFGYDYLDKIEVIFRKEHNSLESALADKKQDYANSIKNLSNRLGLDFKLRKNPSKSNMIKNYDDARIQYEPCINELNRRIEEFPKIESDTDFEEYLKVLQETLNSDEKKQARSIIDSINNLKTSNQGIEPYKTNNLKTSNQGIEPYKTNNLKTSNQGIEPYKTNNLKTSNHGIESNLKSMEKKLNQILSKYDYYYLDSAKNASLLLDLLSISKEYILENNSSICPVCKSDIEPKELSKDIKTEIDELETKLKSIGKLNEETYEFISYLEDLNDNCRLIEKQIELLDESKILDSQRENINAIEKLINELELLAELKLSTREIENPLESINEKLMKMEKYLELSYFNKDKEYEQRLELLNQCIINLIHLDKTQKDIDSIQKEFKLAKSTYDTYRKEKVKYIRNTLDKLTDRINEYYDFIHNNDSINNPKFVVSGSTGLKLRIDSFNKESDPREYSSEGHLDTLGLCIFLAFIKENSPVPIIILDDIVATVDLSHKERISRLLLDEFEDYQLIITTHNKTWFNQIKHMSRARQWRDKDNGKFQFIEITSWNIDEGPHLSNHKTDKEIIEKHLGEHDLVAAVHASRRLLEMVLRNICIANKSRLILKESPYTLLDYLNAAKFSLDKQTKESELKYYYEDLLFEIEQTKYLGNAFVHGDDEDLTSKDAKIFCDAVFELNQAVTCNKCGSYINFNGYTHKGHCTNNKCQAQFDL